MIFTLKLVACLVLLKMTTLVTAESVSKPKVLVTFHDVPKVALDLMNEKCEVIINDEKPYPSVDQIKAKAKGVDAIFWVSKHKLDDDILNAAGPQMKIVSTMSAGVDNIDLHALKTRGIKLGNNPGVVSSAVADLAIFLALGVSRRIIEGRKAIENNQWKFGVRWLLGHEIRDSTVGIVGLGGIGAEIARRCSAFNPKEIIYSGHNEKPIGKELGASFTTFDDLLERSDFIFIACPLTDETRGMFNKEAFAKMKSNAILVNIARGAIVNQEHLIEALKNNTIFGAGLDVMTPEPLPPDHELLKLDNCFVIPHLGTATIKTRDEMAELTAKNLLFALQGDEMITPYKL